MIESSGERDSSTGFSTTVALMGNIDLMPLVSVLQFLEMGRFSGFFSCRDQKDRSSKMVLREGGIVAARYQHLWGVEAVIAALDLREGVFYFDVGEREMPEGARIALSPLLMEAVRLEDEFERIAASYPGDEVALRLRDPHEFPTDPLACGTDVIMATLAARDDATVQQLIESVGLAPVKIRLTAAWLASTDRLRITSGSRPAMSSVMQAKLPWFDSLLIRFAGGVRVVAGVERTGTDQRVINSIKALAKSLDSGPAWMWFGPEGTAMARVRPRSGGLLSIACVPMVEGQQGPFQNLAGTADVVFLCGGAHGDLASWEELAGEVPIIRVSGTMHNDCLLDALEHFATLDTSDRRKPQSQRAPKVLNAS